MLKKSIRILFFAVLLLVFAACANTAAGYNPYTPEEVQNNSDEVMLGFPIMRIYSEYHPFEVEREFWHDGIISIENAEDSWLLDETNVRLRGRGNSTWRYGPEKRPLRLRFNEEDTALLGSETAHRDWILIANHFDLSLMRNYAAFLFGEALGGMSFVPMARFVHLYINDEYVGLYFLTDERDIGEGRVDIEFNEDPTLSGIFLELNGHISDELGGWLAEGHYQDEDYFVIYGRAYDMRWPSQNQDNGHFAYARHYFNRLSSAIRRHQLDVVKSMIDMQSFIDFYIVQEMMKNADVGFFSVFMYISGTGDDRRLFFGPLWDFDQSAGNVTGNDNGVLHPDGIYAGIWNYWYRYLLEIDEFADMIAERLYEVSDALYGVIRHLENITDVYNADFNRNFEVHNHIFELLPNETTRLGERLEWAWVLAPQIRRMHSFDEQAEFLINWLDQRLDWLLEHYSR